MSDRGELYPNMRDTWVKKVMKFEREIPIGLDARQKSEGGGGQNAPPPMGLGLKEFGDMEFLMTRGSLFQKLVWPACTKARSPQVFVGFGTTREPELDERKDLTGVYSWTKSSYIIVWSGTLETGKREVRFWRQCDSEAYCFHGFETWTLRNADVKRLEIIKMWCGVGEKERESNEQVLI